MVSENEMSPISQTNLNQILTFRGLTGENVILRAYGPIYAETKPCFTPKWDECGFCVFSMQKAKVRSRVQKFPA